MLTSPSLPARILVWGGLVALLAVLIERWRAMSGARRWLWGVAMALGAIGCGLIPAMHGRGPLAQPALAVAVAGFAMGFWASLESHGPPRRAWALASAGAMLLASLESVIVVPVLAGGWWFAVAELLWLWGIGVLVAAAARSCVGGVRCGLRVAMSMQVVAVLLAEVGAHRSWGAGSLLEPALIARVAALLVTLVGLVWLRGAERRISPRWVRTILVTVLVMSIWGGAHVWLLAAGVAPTLYLWQ